MADKHNDLWKGRKLLNAQDGQVLENNAAVKEFRDGLERGAAEERAYREYRQGHHEDARAHHFAGMKAALAVGDHEAAHKHGVMYDLHTRAAGKDPMAGIDSAVSSRLDANAQKHYKFRAHKGDGLLVHDHQDAVAKAELAKGDLLRFPSERVAPGKDLGADADVSRIAAASRPFQKPQSMGDTMAGIASKDPKAIMAEMQRTGAKYASLKGGKPPAYQNWSAEIRHHLANNHGGRALDNAGDFGAVSDGLSKRFRIPQAVVQEGLLEHGGRALDNSEDLGHVSDGLARHFLTQGYPVPSVRKVETMDHGFSGQDQAKPQTPEAPANNRPDAGEGAHSHDVQKEEPKPKAKYETCEHCEANFKLAPGEKFPMHTYQAPGAGRHPCPGVGSAVKKSEHPQKRASSDGTGNYDSGVGSYGQGTTGVD
jgi:hypothetical protein